MKGASLRIVLVLMVGYLIAPLMWRSGQDRPHAQTARYAEKLVEDLINNRSRSTAICQLIGLRRYHAKPPYELDDCISRKVRRFIGSPAGSVFGVTLEVDYIDKVNETPLAGELVLFDREGFLIPVYHGANLLMGQDAVFRYRGDDGWAIAHVIGTRVDDDTSVQILSIVPVAYPQRAALRVILGPPQRGFICGYFWSWRPRDVDGDGTPEVEIGQNINAAGDIEPRAVFRWLRDENRYVGPASSPSDGYLRIDAMPVVNGKKDDCCGSAASTEFAEWFPGTTTAGAVYGVLRPACDPPDVHETITIH